MRPKKGPAKPKKKAAPLPKNKKIEWPEKRNIFFRPERMQYVRKQLKAQGCPFCHSAEMPASIGTLCVYKSAHSQIVLNKYPYNNGHLLILPLQHTGELLSLSETQYLDMQLTVRLAVEAIKAVYQPHGYNLGMNHGATGGAGIPDHLHYHIVPRWNGDLNFFPLIAQTKIVIETVEVSYQKFAAYFKERSL